MSLSLPYRRNRRYLTGIDWIIGGLHQSAFKTTGVGSFSQAVLEVAGWVDDAKVRSILDQISARLPILHGRVARDALNLCPFWKLPGERVQKRIALKVIDLPENAEAQAAGQLADHVNSAFESEWQHLRLMLVRLGRVKTRVGLVFDHRLLDATGAEAFLRLIDETAAGRLDELASQMKQTEPAHLDRWMNRFSSGRRINKQMFALNEQDVCALPVPAKGTAKRVKFVFDGLTVEETAKVSDIAASEISLPIVLPSAAARATLAMRAVFPETPLAGEQYLLSTSANSRPPGEPWERFFFNNFSFLLFSMPRSAGPTSSEVAKLFREQFIDQVRERIPEAMVEASALWRILPPKWVAKLTRFLFKGRMCSMYFACVKDTGYPGETFLGLPATNMVHTPLAFAPPGLNLCMTFFAGRFNLVLSYLEGVMSDEQAREMMRVFKQSLVA